MASLLKTIACLYLFLECVYCESDVSYEDYQDHLNPVNDDYNYDNLTKDQDKRTIFTPNVANYGWAKHVAISPSGRKVVLGYAPVDLKYVPVIRPVSIKSRPDYHFKPAIQLKPVVPDSGWRPIVPISHPVHVPVQKPFETYGPPPVHVHPVPVRPVAPPVHVHPVPVRPVSPAVTVVKPVPQPVPPVHVKPVVPVRPVHHVPAVAVPARPLVPSPTLFEVTRPNLGVLPLGATFPSPILPSAPALNIKPAVFAPGIAPVPGYPPGTVVEYHGTHHFQPFAPQVPVAVPQAPHLHPIGQNAAHIHPAHVHPAHVHLDHVHPAQVHPAQVHPAHYPPVQALPPPHAHPLQPLPPAHVHPAHYPPVQALPPPHVHPLQPLPPAHVHPAHAHPAQNIPNPGLPPPFEQPQYPNIPQEHHDVQTPFLPANHPNFFNPQPQFHQFEQPQPEVPNIQQFQQQPQDDLHNFHYINGELVRHDGQQVNQLDQQQFNQFEQQQQHNQQQIIQPGVTDVQIPLHLPQHNFVQQQIPEGFRPSPSLEAPFANRRSGNSTE